MVPITHSMTSCDLQGSRSLRPVISKTARDGDDFNGAPSPSPTVYKSCKKFTWRTYALAERLLVFFRETPGGQTQQPIVTQNGLNDAD